MGAHAKPFIAMFSDMLETDMRPASIKNLSDTDAYRDYRLVLRHTALETAIGMLKSTINSIKNHLSPDDIADIVIALEEFRLQYQHAEESDPQHGCKLECLDFCIDQLMPKD